MNQTSSTDDLRNGPVDDLDRLLGEFFKSQLKQPWPAAPVVMTTAIEPSVLAATRAPEVAAPRNQPAASRDPGSRARYTLAASVALLLGTGWFLSNGFQPGERPAPSAPTNSTPGMLGGGTAGNPEALKNLREDKAKNGDPKTVIPKVELP
jgi:hypothetical protein